MTTKTLITRGAVLLPLVAALPLLSSCALEIVPRWADGTNVLKNGSFEEGAFVPDPNLVMKVLPNDNTTIDGWTVVEGEKPVSMQDIVWMQNGNGFLITTTDGRRFLDLTGSKDVPLGGPFAGVMQHLSTTIGFEYRVCFDIGVFNSNLPFGGPIAVTAHWTNGPNDPKTNPTDKTCGDGVAGDQWTTCGCDEFREFRFKATSGDSFLTIFGKTGKSYIGLDNVRVECVAPLGIHNFCSNGPF